MTISISEAELGRIVNGIKEALRGNAAHRVALDTESLRELETALNALMEQQARLLARASEHNRQAISTNVALSECLAALQTVQDGNLAQRVGESVTMSDNELMANLGMAVNAALADSQRQQQLVIQQQQSLIMELSTPILEIWNGVLVLPIIGAFDRSRSLDVTERLLSELTARRCRFCLLDMTGVADIDEETGENLGRLISAAKLLGSECILTGIRPSVARTMVDIGVDMSKLMTRRNLQAGLNEAVKLISASTSREAHGPRRAVSRPGDVG